MIILAPVAWLYGRIMQIRNALYDRGIFKSHDLGAKTISVGNITLGGTGKTPLVALIAEILAESGEKVCILTRGYGRNQPDRRLLVANGTEILADAFEAGEEPIELAKQLLGKAVVIAEKNRAAAAQWSIQTLGVTAFVLDDGFQHRRAKRDLDIVCIEAINPFGKEQRLLRGWLREPLTNVSRADLIVLTRCDLSENVQGIVEKIERYNSNAEIFLSSTKLLPPRRLEDFLAEREIVVEEIGMPFAFAGLGNPDLFPKTLEHAGYKLAGKQSFPDHTRYFQSDIDRLTDLAYKHGSSSLVTTAKDAVKLGNLSFSIPCHVIEVRTEIDKLEEFRRLIISS